MVDTLFVDIGAWAVKATVRQQKGKQVVGEGRVERKGTKIRTPSQLKRKEVNRSERAS